MIITYKFGFFLQICNEHLLGYVLRVVHITYVYKTEPYNVV